MILKVKEIEEERTLNDGTNNNGGVQSQSTFTTYNFFQSSTRSNTGARAYLDFLQFRSIRED